MRSVRLSRTFSDQLTEYIDAGERALGATVANSKKSIVYSTIRNILANNPGIKRPDPTLGLVVYPISKTPFFVVYDYDDTELRVHFIFINGKPLGAIDPKSVEW